MRQLVPQAHDQFHGTQVILDNTSDALERVFGQIQFKAETINDLFDLLIVPIASAAFFNVKTWDGKYGNHMIAKRNRLL